ncbi:MAG: TonB-dependent receptor plug domain-containing protein [Saprospirales bacterium]|nr:TonB-dependent receptor plug domain-containing protein [Saprospirales bacterium]
MAPASIGVVTGKQIRERGISTLTRPRRDAPARCGHAVGGAPSPGQAFSIRGASEVAGGGIGNRVLLLIDGRPALSPESGRALWNPGSALGSIERIEVVRGAYSPLYGSSAMGGVVNVITRRPAPAPETRVISATALAAGRPRHRIRPVQRLQTLALSHSRRSGKFSYLLMAAWKTDDGQRKSGFDLFTSLRQTTWAFNAKHHLQASANANRSITIPPPPG